MIAEAIDPSEEHLLDPFDLEDEEDEEDEEGGEKLGKRTLSRTDSVTLFLKDAVEHNLLTPDQEQELGKLVDEGRKARKKLKSDKDLSPNDKRRLRRVIKKAEEAQDTFVAHNYQLVISIAKKYMGRGVDLEDLSQFGNFGLMRAAKKFDYKKGFKFSTYATHWIDALIREGVQETGRTIRVPEIPYYKMMKVLKAQQDLLKILTRNPTPEEIAVKIDMPVEKVKEMILLARDTVELDDVREDSAGGNKEGWLDLQDSQQPRQVEFQVQGTGIFEQFSELLSEALTEDELEVVEYMLGFREGSEQKSAHAAGIAMGWRLNKKEIQKNYDSAMAKLSSKPYKDKLEEFLDLDF